MRTVPSSLSPALRRSGGRRSGSALFIVLGLLAVLMLLGVSFSVFVQTEHAGSTNLKNSLVARQALNTAIGRVMEAIDLSFGSPSNNWPVCVWPQAWLASSEFECQDYYQSEILPDGEVPAAQVLTADAAKYLTPAQKAMAKSAACGWAPVYAAIEAEGPRTDTGGGILGNKGRDNADSVIGRYAFVAFETTGLLDANAAGAASQSGRAANAGEDPMTYCLPSPSEKASYERVIDHGDNNFTTETFDVPHVLKNVSTFISNRNRTKDSDGWPQIPSFADLRTVAGATLDETVPDKNGLTSDNLASKPFPADLFNTFYASLADLDPDGMPKVSLPPATVTENDARLFASRGFQAMVKVFANSRADTSYNINIASQRASSNEGDQYTFFEGTDKSYTLTRARLATVAMLDAMDADFAPGEWTAANGFSAWQRLPDYNGLKVDIVDANGHPGRVSVADKLPNRIKLDGSLNLPCTENVPLLSRVYVRIGFNPNVSSANAGMTKVNGIDTPYVDIEGGITMCAVAGVQGDGPKASGCKLEVECDLLTSTPKSGTVSGVDTSDNIAKRIWDPAASQPHAVWECPDLDNFYPSAHFKRVTFSGTGGGSKLEAQKQIGFKVRLFAAGWDGTKFDPTKVPSSTKNLIEIPSGSGVWFYPPTLAQEQETGDVFLPFRFKTKITAGGKTVQEVPAPALGDDYRVRVDAGVWHTKGSAMVSPAPTKNDALPGIDQAVGWAMCLDPVFGFDTTSLRSSGQDTIQGNSKCNFWVNNVAGYCGSGQMWTELNKFMAKPGDAENALYPGENWNHLQLNWLFNDAYNFETFTRWMMRGSDLSVRPDMLHSDDMNGQPFCKKGGSVNLAKVKAQLPAVIPNEPFKSVGQLGNVRIGPYETLATVRSYRYGTGGVTDFHRVVDYFTTIQDRYPAYGAAGGPTVNTSTGDIDYGDCTELFSGIARGRVNLNMPPLVRWNTKKGVRATTKDMPLNPHPVIAALRGAALGSSGTISFDLASKIATRIAQTAGEEVENDTGFRRTDGQTFTVRKKVVRRLSDLGWAEINGRNPILTDIMQTSVAARDSDAEREGYIGNAVNAFTTRGQTFVVVIRADAYTPRYGEESSTGDGTTLATTHAVVELFRDPEYARYPDGEPLHDADGTPVFFHNWYIKSFHVL